MMRNMLALTLATCRHARQKHTRFDRATLLSYRSLFKTFGGVYWWLIDNTVLSMKE